MLAVKHRHAEAPIGPALRPAEPIRVVGAPQSSRTSPPRELQEMLEARLSTSVVAVPQARFSPVAKAGIVITLATAAWMPIIAAVLVFSS